MPTDNTRYEYSAITQRPAVRWPNRGQLAVWVCYTSSTSRSTGRHLSVAWL